MAAPDPAVFHPIVAGWFSNRFPRATEPQLRAWPALAAGRDVLISAPTGSGKTLAAFLVCIDRLFRAALDGELEDRIEVVYVSPLKALGNDVQKNLDGPLAEICGFAGAQGVLVPPIRTAVRSGDTGPSERQRMLRHPPHILVTTPESLFILLTAERSRAALATVRTVIVDEIHAVVRDKRGSHLALSLARLDRLVGQATSRTPQRIGLSATVSPIERVARFLSPDAATCGTAAAAEPATAGELGAQESWGLEARAGSTVEAEGEAVRIAAGPDGLAVRRSLQIIDAGHRREMDLAVEVPRDELGPVASSEMWGEIYDRLAELAQAHRTTLVFVNTRRLAERVAHHLGERLGERAALAHHGSLSRRLRLTAEERLKRGDLRVVVATASLELGIDIGSVDLVCQIGSPRSIAVALQRIGRSGHHVDVGRLPKGRIFVTTRDELIESAALVRAIRAGALDRVQIPAWPRDVLAQQIVAAAASEPWRVDDLFELVREASPYRDLPRAEFDAVVEMLSEGIATRRGRAAGAYLHRDGVNGIVRGRRSARMTAITSGGAIPENANYLVVAEPEGAVVGTVDEDFAVESLAGDVFLLGTTSWRIRRVEAGRVRVEDAHGAPPSIPFWRGEAPGRTEELSAEVARVREAIASAEGPEGACRFLVRECGLDKGGAEQAVAYVRAGASALGAVPTCRTIVAERFFDEGGGMQLVLHAPLGSRINRAWGLALRKRFCRSFNLELQAAATDDGIVISLAEQHSFPLDAVFRFLAPETVEEVLTQAMLPAPMFGARWRWNASRALAVLRFAGGRKVPAPIQRMRSDDLLAAVFPDQAACPENLPGDIRIPDHPLVNETIRDSLHEAMDLEGLKRLLAAIQRGEIRTVAIDTPQPSPFSHEILNANPYAFLDDAPLEERRARAVQLRRTLGADNDEMGALDAAAIATVAVQAWPVVRDAEELHDALLTLVVLDPDQRPAIEEPADYELAARSAEGGAGERPTSRRDAADWTAWFAELVRQRRAALLQCGERTLWVAAERMRLARGAYPDVRVRPELPAIDATAVPDPETCATEIVRGWMDSIGPTTASRLAARLALDPSLVDVALVQLESEGQVLRGHFTAPAGAHGELEWCHRRLLARIHRLTIGRLRREIEPVTSGDFMRFLFRWQHVAPGTALHGVEGALRVLEQLQGYEVMAGSWEREILASRIAGYSPELLDRLCLSGELMWGRLSPPATRESGAGTAPWAAGSDDRRVASLHSSSPRRPRPTRVAPIAIFRRDDAAWLMEPERDRTPIRSDLSPEAREVLDALDRRGASFLSELRGLTGRTAGEVEAALWELSACGLVTADGFDNLRALLDPVERRRQPYERARAPRHAAGRWARLAGAVFAGREPDGPDERSAERAESFARQLLVRWGVVFRDLIARETLGPPWRELLVAFRRLEARGEIRGGRFVAGFVGEQFARPDAVEALRAVRSLRQPGPALHVPAADPLNLAGIITPGPRVSPLSGQIVEVLGPCAPLETEGAHAEGLGLRA